MLMVLFCNVMLIVFVSRSVAKNDGFTVCPNLAGHGIGSMFHGPPEILHTGVLEKCSVCQV